MIGPWGLVLLTHALGGRVEALDSVAPHQHDLASGDPLTSSRFRSHPRAAPTAHAPTLSPLRARGACKATDDAYLEHRQARQHDYPCRTAAGQQARGE